MFSAMKTEERRRVRELRRLRGLSVRELAAAVGVSKSSVSLWVRDIALTEEQLADLQDRNPAYNHQRNGAAVLAARGRERRVSYQNEGRALVRGGDEDFIRCCLLYWAEGEKARHKLSFSNADPELVRLWVGLLRVLSVPEKRIRISCYLYADHTRKQRDIENFWLELTDLTKANLCRSIVNNSSRSSQRKRRNMLPYGTCKVNVHDTRLIQMVLGGIQEIGGFERDAWLE
jgi:transcriptional regulator with XRE-family HTH domain